MYTTKLQLTLVILLLLASGMFMTTTADAQNVHALLIIMDADGSIGPEMKLDQGTVEKFLSYVNTFYPVKKEAYLSSMGRARGNDVLNWIRSVRPGSDDVVLVYYTGHGGMVSNTDRRTFLNLEDGRLYRSDLENAMKSVSCRLKLLITDACSSAPDPPGGKTVPFGAQIVGKNHIKNLLGEHQGYLSISGATEGEYGWCTEGIGGSTFTLGLMEAITERADDPTVNRAANGDGFVSWDEVFALSKEGTKTYFEQIYPGFSTWTKDDLKRRGITGQNPKAYSMPKPIRYGGGSSGSDIFDSLWELDNPQAGFNINVVPDKTRYHIGDYLTLRMNVSDPCYVTVLNWDKEGTFAVLFPNKFRSNNYIVPGQMEPFPHPTKDHFAIKLPGPVGTERFKVIAVRTQAANNALQNVLAKSITRKPGDDFIKISRIEGRVMAEDSILDELERLHGVRRGDWSVSRTSITLRK